MMADSLKKSRKSNFSQEEVDILVKTVAKNYDVLYGEYSKRAIYKNARHQAWLDVTNEVNQVSIEKRTLQEVKNKWKKCQHLYRGEEIVDISDEFDSMPLEQRLKSPNVPSTSEQEQILHSHALSPTKLKVTRQSKPREPSPKIVTPPPPPIEDVCLKWNSHHGNMQSMFPALLLKEQYVDATLVAEGQTLKCHRMILSSCSPYFEEVLGSISPYQHPVLFMKDMPFWILKCLCDFMYTGEVMISQDKLNELLAVAENLKIKGLAGKPDIPNEDLQKEVLNRHIKEEKKDDPVIEKEPEKKDPPKDKKRHHYGTATNLQATPEPPPPKNAKMPKANTSIDTPTAKTSKTPKVSTFNESPVVKSSVKAAKVAPSYAEIPISKTFPSKVLRSSSTLKKIERADKLLIKEAISKGDILDPFDLLEPVYEEVQKEPKPPSIPNKTKEAIKNIPMKKGMQKKVKKRKITDDRDESPPPVLSRKGTRSRPNKKIPRFYHSGFDNSTPKIQESPETTIVREPHTSQAESQAPSLSTQAVLHSDQVGDTHSDHGESHMDQADPLFQPEDIKAEPFDLEDSTIEIEDSVVNFTEPDTSMTEEELLEETFEPVISFKQKTVIEKLPDPKPFKKIRVTRRQGRLDVDKANIVKIVDVDKIKVSASVVEEDPLNLHSNLDNSIKIITVESIDEKVDFKICEIAGQSDESKEIDENPLGFQITNVVSEIEEQKEDESLTDTKPDVPVCQIAEVFSETEDESNKHDVDPIDVVQSLPKLESSEASKTFKSDGKDDCSHLKDTEKKLGGSCGPKTPEGLGNADNTTGAASKDTRNSDESNGTTKRTDEIDDLNEVADDLQKALDNSDIGDRFKKTDESQSDRTVIASQISDTFVEPNSASSPDETNLEEELESAEPVQDLNETSDVANDSKKVAEDTMKPAEDLMKSTEDLVETPEDTVETAEDLVETAEDLVETAEDLVETPEDLVETIENPVENSESAVETSGIPAETVVHPSETEENLVKTVDNLNEINDTLYENSITGASTTNDDSTEIIEDSTVTCSDSSEPVVIAEKTSVIFGDSQEGAEYIESSTFDGELLTSAISDPSTEETKKVEILDPNVIEAGSCLDATFDVTTGLSNSEDVDMPTDESRTKDPVLANAVPYTNEDLSVVSARHDDIQMEVCEESFSQEAPSFDQTSNSFELVPDVAPSDSSSFGAPGFHIAQVISEQIAMNEECRLTTQPMDTSETCFEGSVTSSNELEMIVNDLTKIVGESHGLESNMEHEDIADSLENLLEK